MEETDVDASRRAVRPGGFYLVRAAGWGWRGAHRSPPQARRRALLLVVLLVGAGLTIASELPRAAAVTIETQSLDGRGNNLARPDFGSVGSNYLRVAPPNYADGLGAPVAGPNSRFVSNRVFNDNGQNIFDENDLSRWVSAWGQFIDVDMAFKDDDGARQDIAFGANDPVESFANGRVLPFTRSAAAKGTGVTSPREQVNTVSSFLDASNIYGSSADRLEFLRVGSFDGNLTNNSAFLLLPGGQLPRRDARGNPAKAPKMVVEGRLAKQANRAAVAGDERANQNVTLQAIHTLFAREHNNIVTKLPSSLSEEQKFQIARRVVIAEMQFITYNQFLPTLGIRLDRFDGYDPDVNPTLANEFATVGFRAHSMVHGTVDLETDAVRYQGAQIRAFKALGIRVVEGGEDGDDRTKVALEVPLNVAFFNPDLLPQLQLGPLLQGLGLEPQYRNDEQIDNQLRSVLFQIPARGNAECLDGETLPKCFKGVTDLGAIDIERGRDHGMPLYNDLRRAYGLAPVRSFTDLTGEDSEAFPADQALTRGQEINDPDSLDFVELRDADGELLRAGSEASEEETVTAVRRTTLAARLKAIYGSTDKVDAFVGMVSERHVSGTSFGALQTAIWKKQFEDLRDGDRFFFENDPGLSDIRRAFGIDFRRSLADIIADNTDIRRADLNDNVFRVAEEDDDDADEQRDQGVDSSTRPTPSPSRSTPNRTTNPTSSPRAGTSSGTRKARPARLDVPGGYQRQRLVVPS